MSTAKKPLPQSKHIDAISWAADRADMSYGKFVQSLSEDDRRHIYDDYRDYLDKNLEEIGAFMIKQKH